MREPSQEEVDNMVEKLTTMTKQVHEATKELSGTSAALTVFATQITYLMVVLEIKKPFSVFQ